MPRILGLNGVRAEFRAVSNQTRRKISRSLKGRKRNPYKDPNGGLTAAGRRRYNETTGSQLKPGVRRKGSAMKLNDYRRKGSFLRRHYGGTVHPLKKPNGQPTRYALQARAWGEPAPASPEAVNRLANKGTRLLKRYHTMKKPKR